MSELKAHRFLWIDEVWPNANLGQDYYPKSEVDKVLEDLIEKNNRLANKDMIMASETIKDLYKELRHQKFMRCNRLIDYCGLKQNTCEEEKVPFWRKWYLRWCELSDKFKETK